MQDETLAVLYAAKSTADPRGSIPTQLAECRAAAEREGREVVAEYSDEGKSAYSGSRGPGLEAARAHAERLRADGGDVELWVQHSDRLARGDAVAAAHLIEYVLWSRKLGVRLRSVQDDGTFGDLIHAVLMGERNTEDSRRKSEAVRAGKRRQLDRGERLGGPVPDGYRRGIQPDGRAVYALDPERAPIIRRLFALAEQGMGDPSIARTLNAEGVRTRGGIPWTRRRVQDTVRNPFYAGRVVAHRGTSREDVRDGQHPALLDAGVFDRLRVERGARDRAQGSQRDPRGRPPTNYALARLARCGQCGSAMYGSTSTYRRKDGTKRKSYECGNFKFATGVCDASPIDAELVDRAVIANLSRYLGDFEAWRSQIEAGHTAERDRLEGEVERARVDIDELDRKASMLAGDYEHHRAAGEDAEARVLLRMLTGREQDRERAQRRAQAAQDALAAVPHDAEADAMLDFYNALGAAVRGRMEGADSLAKVNRALRDLFRMFVLSSTAEGVAILPVLGDEAVIRARQAAGHAVYPELEDVATGEERIVPPLRPIHPAENAANAHG